MNKLRLRSAKCIPHNPKTSQEWKWNKKMHPILKPMHSPYRHMKEFARNQTPISYMGVREKRMSHQPGSPLLTSVDHCAAVEQGQGEEADGGPPQPQIWNLM